MRIVKSLFLLLFFSLMLPATSVLAAVPASGKTMIVLDASGSMWGKIQGRSKIEIARGVIRDLLKGWDKRIELGLATYGHRRKGDCSDIEVLVPVGKGTERAVFSAVQGLQPKGKTPLSDAVQMAANSLKYTEERATVILVSDGKETCDADPCALGKVLEKRGVDFTAHVIGFDVKKHEEVGLRCLAQNTGGLYTQASDASGLKKALEKTVVEVKKKVVKAVPKKKVVKKESGVKLVALYKAGGKEYKGDINWFVLESKVDLAGKRKQLAHQHRGKSGHIFRNLPPGKHKVIAKLSDAGHITREFDLEVKAGDAVVHELPLNIGTVRFDARFAEGAPPFKGDLGWKILSTKTDLSGKRQEIANFWRKKSGSIFLIPAGTWLVTGTFADARYINIKREISVEPGGEEAHDFVFNVGRVRFDARFAEGAQPTKVDLGWNVFNPKKDLSGNRQKLTDFWRKKSGTIFLLPAGKWLITGTLADARYINVQREIVVEPAGEEVHDFVFNAARIKLEGYLAEGKRYQGDLGWVILNPKADLSGKRAKLTDFWRKRSGNVFILPAGDWVLQGTLADYRHINGEQTFTLKAGEDQLQKMIFNAGKVRVDVTVNENPHAGGVGWTVYAGKASDALTGKRAKITDAWRKKSGHVTILHAGDYVMDGVVPDDRATKGSIAFGVAAGEEKSVTLNLAK